MVSIRKNMVAGFALRGKSVLMVRKLKPGWQLDLLNGVGGKCEEHETPIDAMVREFHEETGCLIDDRQWAHFCTEIGPDYIVHFYRAEVDDGWIWPQENDVGETLRWVHAHDVTSMRCVGNCYWLVPLAMDWRRVGRPLVFETQDAISGRPTW